MVLYVNSQELELDYVHVQVAGDASDPISPLSDEVHGDALVQDGVGSDEDDDDPPSSS